MENSDKLFGREGTEMPLVVVWPGQRNRDHGSEESLSYQVLVMRGGGGAVTPPSTAGNTSHFKHRSPLSQAIVSPFTQIAHSQRHYYYKQTLFARRARDPRPVQRRALLCVQTERWHTIRDEIWRGQWLGHLSSISPGVGDLLDSVTLSKILYLYTFSFMTLW